MYELLLIVAFLTGGLIGASVMCILAISKMKSRIFLMLRRQKTHQAIGL